MAPLVPVTEYCAHVVTGLEPLPAETVGLAEALGRVLATDVVAERENPPFATSAMDGYAVRRADLATVPTTLRVVADLPAGSAEDPALAPGTCARIMTGAPVPSAADAVVPVEATDAGSEHVRIDQTPQPHAHIRDAGEDLRPGDLVVAAGHLLTARALAAIATAGQSQVSVRRRPRVGVIATGDELRAPGEALTRGAITDSNSTLVAHTLSEHGATPVPLGRVGDDPGDLLAALEHSADEVDAWVLTGGVSVGAFDVTKLALTGRGMTFTTVAMQPGKPQGFGTFAGHPIFGLPGNPVSVFVSLQVVVRPAIDRWLGRTPSPPRRAVVTEGWRSPAARAQYAPVRLAHDGERLTAVPASERGSGSHLAGRMARADALAIVPAEVTAVGVGDVLDVIDL